MDMFASPIHAFLRAVATELETDLTLIDVGCAGGLYPEWRVLGDRLAAIGIDCDAGEVARLAAAEAFPKVRYRSAFIDGESDALADPVQRNPWARLSVSQTVETRAAKSAPSSHALAQESAAPPAVPSISLPDLFVSEQVDRIDFIKIDVDGDDFRILRSIEADLANRSVLGLSIEVNFFGSDDPACNTFHNVDRPMKRAGFELFDLSVRRYSGRAMPARYVLDIPAPSLSGRVLQGDATYFRDPALWSDTPAALLKLASLFALFGLADCAAEAAARSGRSDLIEHLVPPAMPGQAQQTYAQYLAAFAADDPQFYTLRETPRKSWLTRLQK